LELKLPQRTAEHERRLDALLTLFPGLVRSAAAKWAWWLMYTRAAGCTVDRTFDINPAQLAMWQGTDPRCGKDYLRLLAENALVILICTDGPIWKVSLNDPLVAAIARRGPESHGQGELFEREAPIEESTDEPKILPVDRRAPDALVRSTERSGDAAQHSQALAVGPPAGTSAQNSPAPPLPSEELNLLKTSTFGTLRNFGKEGSIPVSAAGGDFRAEDPGAQVPPAIGAVFVNRFLGLPSSPTERIREVERLVAHIKKRVNDPKLRDTPCLSVARAVADGEYPIGELCVVLASLDRHRETGTLRAEPWSYFVGAVKQSRARNDKRNR
jgi:hypothetical protein